MVNSIIEGVANFFMKCPLLRKGVFHVDSLGDRPIEYVIETGIFTPVQKTYVNGDTERIFQFNFGSREYYAMDRIRNIDNSEFYERLANWVEEQNKLERFPEMPEKCTPRELSVLSPGYLFDSSGRNARYQIQLQLTYYKEV